MKQFYLFALGVLFLISSITANVARASDEFYALLHELKTNNLGRWEASRTVLRNYAANYNIAVDSLRADSDSTYTYSLARLVLAQALHEQGDYSSSTQLCNGAINYFYDGQDTVHAFTSLVLQSSNFIQLGLSADAVPLIVKSQALASSAADSVLQVRALAMMGALYLSVAKPDASMVYITEAIEQCRHIRSEFHDKLLTDLLCQQCEAFLQLGSAEQGLVPLMEAIEMSDENAAWQLRSKTHRLLGDVYLALHRYPKAEQAYLEALYLSQQEVNLTQRVYILRQLGELRASQNRRMGCIGLQHTCTLFGRFSAPRRLTTQYFMATLPVHTRTRSCRSTKKLRTTYILGRLARTFRHANETERSARTLRKAIARTADSSTAPPDLTRSVCKTHLGSFHLLTFYPLRTPLLADASTQKAFALYGRNKPLEEPLFLHHFARCEKPRYRHTNGTGTTSYLLSILNIRADQRIPHSVEKRCRHADRVPPKPPELGTLTTRRYTLSPRCV